MHCPAGKSAIAQRNLYRVFGRLKESESIGFAVSEQRVVPERMSCVSVPKCCVRWRKGGRAQGSIVRFADENMRRRGHCSRSDSAQISARGFARIAGRGRTGLAESAGSRMHVNGAHRYVACGWFRSAEEASFVKSYTVATLFLSSFSSFISMVRNSTCSISGCHF